MNINGKEYVLADGKQQELIKKLEKENEKLKAIIRLFPFDTQNIIKDSERDFTKTSQVVRNFIYTMFHDSEYEDGSYVDLLIKIQEYEREIRSLKLKLVDAKKKQNNIYAFNTTEIRNIEKCKELFENILNAKGGEENGNQ